MRPQMPTSTLTGQACSCLSCAMQCGCRACSSFLQAERPTCFHAGGMIDDNSDERYAEEYAVLNTPYPRMKGVLCTEYLVCNINSTPNKHRQFRRNNIARERCSGLLIGARIQRATSRAITSPTTVCGGMKTTSLARVVSAGRPQSCAGCLRQREGRRGST